MTATSDYVQNWANTFPNSVRPHSTSFFRPFILTGSDQSCVDFSEENFIKVLNITIPNSNRAWTWQTCTEFGFYSTSYPGTSVFWGDIPLGPFLQWCSQAFDIPNMSPNINWTNTFYG